MASITKTQFVNDINAVLRTLSNAKKNATATDVTISAGTITLNDFNSVVVGDLPSNNVSSSDLQTMLENYTREFSQVRTVRFLKNINGVYTYQYSRFARIVDSGVPLLDDSYIQPNVTVYDDIQPLEDIDLVKYQNILTVLSGTLNVNFSDAYTDKFFCHSSCHSNCHSSRGRR